MLFEHFITDVEALEGKAREDKEAMLLLRDLEQVEEVNGSVNVLIERSRHKLLNKNCGEGEE